MSENEQLLPEPLVAYESGWVVVFQTILIAYANASQDINPLLLFHTIAGLYVQGTSIEKDLKHLKREPPLVRTQTGNRQETGRSS